jgi:putative ABC transport system permease protein
MTPQRHLLNPLILGVRLSVLFGLYRQRLRNHTVGELLAGSGIAVGVALVFGVLVANGSIVGSAREIIHAVDGSASLELSARSPAGFGEGLANRAAGLPGVKDSALLLRESAVLLGPGGRQAVQLVGVSAGVIGLGGSATRDLGAGALLLSGGVGLPSDVANSIGAQTEHTITLMANGATHTTRVRAVLNAGAIGALSSSGIAVALLPSAQALTGRPGRVTEVLIRPYPGHGRQVTGELRALAGSHVDLGPADNELRLVSAAAKPTSQSTTLFAAISVMVGFLFALNAMLLTIPERRRTIADMRSQGFDSRQVLTILAFQALALGVGASLIGVAIGYGLARTLFHEVPSYLATTFPITGHQVIHLTTVLAALACGLGASLLASFSPVLDLRPNRPIDAVLHKPGEPGQSVSEHTARRASLIGLATITLLTVLVLVDAGLTVLGGVMLALAALCLIPLVFRSVTRALRKFGRRYHGGMLAVTVIELDATATRAVALAGIAALAVYGSIAVGGARNDLIHGLDQAIAQDSGTAAIWVTTGDSVFNTSSFHANGVAQAIARAPGIASVRVDQGGLLDVGDRRLLIRAHSPDAPAMLQSSQLLHGNFERATELMRAGGWASVSEGFAEEHHLDVDDRFTLPTPSGALSLRVAAITTNLGWSPGAITLSTVDFRRGWQTTDPTALEVSLKPDLTPAAGKRAVQAALGRNSGLSVQTSHEREAQADSTLHQGLRSLGQISTLILLTAALALAAALSTAIHQRRMRLASLKAQGFDRFQLWRGLLLESVVVLAIGCLDGGVLGLYGHALADRYLQLSTGFPAPFGVGWIQVTLALLVVAGISLAVVALPGYSATGVPTRASFQE